LRGGVAIDEPKRRKTVLQAWAYRHIQLRQTEGVSKNGLKIKHQFMISGTKYRESSSKEIQIP
jgi:hypothetical protein